MIYIVDEVMGSGKTQFAIKKMNEEPDKNFIYITPYLKEAERVKLSCWKRDFKEPDTYGQRKIDSLHNLLKNEKQIASTHALFQNYNEDTRELISAGGYTLIMDEVCNVVEPVNLSKDDLGSIMSKFAHEEDGLVIWDDMEYDGRFNDIKNMSLNKSLILFNDSFLVWNFPVSIFESFKDVYIMTYLFDAQIQKYYYDYYGIKYKKIEIEKVNPNTKFDVDIYEGKLNLIGDADYSLSSSWFLRDKMKQKKLFLPKIKNNMNYYFRKLNSGKSYMWTTFKEYSEIVSPDGMKKSFVSINLRSTNEYIEKDTLIYACNIFINPVVKQFFHTRGITVNEDLYATSELVQWIFRSAIRKLSQIILPVFSSFHEYRFNHHNTDFSFQFHRDHMAAGFAITKTCIPT